MFDVLNIKTQEQVEAEELLSNTIALTAEQKQIGLSYQGINISLTEENQNGIASVMAGATLAIKYNSSIFPLKFNASTADSVVSLDFQTLETFELFSLEFLQARQAFFS